MFFLFLLLQQPGKLNLKDFAVVNDAIARMNVGGEQDGVVVAGGGGGGHNKSGVGGLGGVGEKGEKKLLDVNKSKAKKNSSSITDHAPLAAAEDDSDHLNGGGGGRRSANNILDEYDDDDDDVRYETIPEIFSAGGGGGGIGGGSGVGPPGGNVMSDFNLARQMYTFSHDTNTTQPQKPPKMKVRRDKGQQSMIIVLFSTLLFLFKFFFPFIYHQKFFIETEIPIRCQRKKYILSF